MLTLLLIGLLTSIVNVQPSKAKEAMDVKPDVASGVLIGTDWSKTCKGVDFDVGLPTIPMGAGTTTQYPWSMFRHDLDHTGYTESPAPNTNNNLWSYATGGAVLSSPAVVDGRVYVGSDDHKVYCLNASTGAFIWSYTTGSYVSSSPAVCFGRVYVGSQDKKVYCLNATTGARIWSYTTGKWVSSSPAVADRMVFIGSCDNKVYAFGSRIITVPDDYPTIQEAINAANPEDTIFIKNGIYFEEVILNKTVSLVGENQENTIIDGRFLNASTGVAITVSADGASISNLMTANHGVGIAISSSYNVVCENIITNNTFAGIFMFGCANNTLQRNHVDYCTCQGIQLGDTEGNNISENTIEYCDRGLAINYSSYNTVTANVIKECTSDLSDGIFLTGSPYNVFAANFISANSHGVGLLASNNSIFYHNNFVDNTYQLFDYAPLVGCERSVDSWDDGYPSGGNYWGDYSGADLYRGAYQNETGSDGIGDTHYTINAVNTDNYPLMGIFGTPTAEGENVTVFPTENLSLTFQNVTAAGSTTVNKTGVGPEPPLGFEFAGQYYDIQTTAGYSGQIEIRIIYDDSNMSLLAEEALRLRQWNTTQWINITTYVDVVNNVIYGVSPHLSMFGVTMFAPLSEGIAVTDSACSKTVVGEGCNVIVNVTVRNQGGSTKTFDVFTYADATVIGKQTVLDLAPSAQVTVTFTWNTSGCAKGIYTVSVSDQLISLVTVTIPGDVDGTFEVDIYDITAICVCYNSKIGDSLYYPNCDIDGNGIIDIYDVTTACITYGQKYP
jgi:parallel beta-helix repeat protein